MEASVELNSRLQELHSTSVKEDDDYLWEKRHVLAVPAMDGARSFF